MAAEKLSRQLRIPSWKGSIFVWLDDGVSKLVVSADRDWLATHPSVPSEVDGYPVEITDRIIGKARAR